MTRSFTGHPLARRRDDGLVEVVRRTLCRDVKDGQAFDLVAEEVETQRLVVLGGPDVHDATAHRDLGAVFDQVLTSITHGDEPFDELVAINLAAAREHVRRTQRFR